MAEFALEKGIYNQACFHSQQGVEKSLKGFLDKAGAKLPRTHLLRDILALCQNYEKEFSNFENECLILDQYYIPTRYPDALIDLPGGLPSEDKAKEALEILRKIYSFVNEILSEIS